MVDYHHVFFLNSYQTSTRRSRIAMEDDKATKDVRTSELDLPTDRTSRLGAIRVDGGFPRSG